MQRRKDYAAPCDEGGLKITFSRSATVMDIAEVVRAINVLHQGIGIAEVRIAPADASETPGASLDPGVESEFKVRFTDFDLEKRKIRSKGFGRSEKENKDAEDEGQTGKEHAIRPTPGSGRTADDKHIAGGEQNERK